MTLSADEQIALSRLVHRYGAHVDARRFDAVADLFTADAELVLPDPPGRLDPCINHHGRSGVRQAMSALDNVTRTHHGIVGEIYTAAPEADVATGKIAGVAHHWVNAGGKITDHVWYLRYRDTYRRAGRDWQIAARALTIDAIESRPAQRVRA